MSEGERPSRPGAIIAVSMFSAGVLYFLSVGPVIHFYYPKPPSYLARFYAPLDWLYDSAPPLQPFLEWYGSLWIPKQARSTNGTL